MRPWVLWLVRHRMRWVALAILAVTGFPVYFAVYLYVSLFEAWDDVKSDWRTILNLEPK